MEHNLIRCLIQAFSFGKNSHIDSDQPSEDEPCKDFPGNGEKRDAPVVAAVCPTTPILEQRDCEGVTGVIQHPLIVPQSLHNTCLFERFKGSGA